MDAIATMKEEQKKAWATFAPTEMYTCGPAARLVGFAGVRNGQSVLDVACGTGVVSLAAARLDARVTGLDFTPSLIARARENAAIAGVEIAWHEGDAEALPFADASFDVVLSQFGHMFAPRPDVATREILRVLKPGGTVAFTTWPPELFTGRTFALVAKYLPPPPPGIPPPIAWGSPDVVRERLGAAVTNLVFDRGVLRFVSLSVPHVRLFIEQNVGPMTKIVRHLTDDAPKLAEFRRDLDGLIAAYFEPAENALRQDYLMTRAIKTS